VAGMGGGVRLGKLGLGLVWYVLFVVSFFALVDKTIIIDIFFVFSNIDNWLYLNFLWLFLGFLFSFAKEIG
jgi:hypothetical protein